MKKNKIMRLIYGLNNLKRNKMKQETLEEAIDKASLLEFPIKEWYGSDDYSREEITAARDGFKRGAKWQQKISYSEEEVLKLLISKEENTKDSTNYNGVEYLTPEEWFEQFKKK